MYFYNFHEYRAVGTAHISAVKIRAVESPALTRAALFLLVFWIVMEFMRRGIVWQQNRWVRPSKRPSPTR